MHKIVIFFMNKKNNEKNVCLPYLKFSDLLPETHFLGGGGGGGAIYINTLYHPIHTESKI